VQQADSRVIDQNIKTSKGCHRGLDQVLGRVRVGEIGLYCQVSRSRHEPEKLLCLRLGVAMVDDDTVTGRGKGQSGGAPDPARRSGHHDRPVSHRPTPPPIRSRWRNHLSPGSVGDPVRAVALRSCWRQ
jgi:hypothetical protein